MGPARTLWWNDLRSILLCWNSSLTLSSNKLVGCSSFYRNGVIKWGISWEKRFAHALPLVYFFCVFYDWRWREMEWGVGKNGQFLGCKFSIPPRKILEAVPCMYGKVNFGILEMWRTCILPSWTWIQYIKRNKSVEYFWENIVKPAEPDNAWLMRFVYF